MIKGIGVDICSISRIKKLIQKDRRSFFENTFSQNELKEANNYGDASQFFASRFAAKEAFLKCLELGVFNDKLSLNEISIEKEKYGKPFVIIKNTKMANELKSFKIHLSISHEENICTAFVIIESN